VSDESSFTHLQQMRFDARLKKVELQYKNMYMINQMKMH